MGATHRRYTPQPKGRGPIRKQDGPLSSLLRPHQGQKMKSLLASLLDPCSHRKWANMDWRRNLQKPRKLLLCTRRSQFIMTALVRETQPQASPLRQWKPKGLPEPHEHWCTMQNRTESASNSLMSIITKDAPSTRLQTTWPKQVQI